MVGGCDRVHASHACVAAQVLSDGHVYFTNEGKPRPSAAQALDFAFVQPALVETLEPAAVPEAPPPPERRGFLGLFSNLQSRVAGLEDDIIRTVRHAPHLGMARALPRAAWRSLCTVWFALRAMWRALVAAFRAVSAACRARLSRRGGGGGHAGGAVPP